MPKTLGIGAFFGALVVGTIMIPVGIFVPNPIVAIAIIGGLWLLLIVAQAVGWYRNFFRVRPSQARLRIARAKAEAAQAHMQEVLARNAILDAERKAALSEYQLASQEGREALDALRARAKNLDDQKRVLRAMQDFSRAQTSASDEPDFAAKMKLQAEAMRRETRHIQTISFTF